MDAQFRKLQTVGLECRNRPSFNHSNVPGLQYSKIFNNNIVGLRYATLHQNWALHGG